MKRYILTLALLIVIFPVRAVFAQVPVVVPPQLPPLTAKGIAIYGWQEGKPVPLYVKNEHTLYPVASITKLITALAVQKLYPSEMRFAISQAAYATEGSIAGIKVGAQFTRDDLLKALLIMSSNDAATAFMEPIGKAKFLATMNDILHTNNYTTTSFTNPSGLDPARKLGIKPNRMTPFHLSELLSDIYETDPLLVGIMNNAKVSITDLKTNTPVEIRQSNGLYLDENYKEKVLMGKTGLTALAGQNLAFVTEGDEVYDYITIVILGSKSRMIDSKKILDWIAATNDSKNYGG